MSVEFEMEAGQVVLMVAAYTNDALVVMEIDDEQGGPGFSGDFTGDQMRQLRRFLEWTYPASEDPLHEPDPWMAGSHGATIEIPWSDP